MGENLTKYVRTEFVDFFLSRLCGKEQINPV